MKMLVLILAIAALGCCKMAALAQTVEINGKPGIPKPTPAPTPLTLVLTVNKRTGIIIKQSIPAGTKIPCDTPVKVIYK